MREERQTFHRVAVLFPNHLLKRRSSQKIRRRRRCAYNAWLIDRWLTRAGAAQLPHRRRRPGKRRARVGNMPGPGVVAVYLPTAGVDPLWGDRKYDPIYQAAQDADLPSCSTPSTGAPVFPFQLQGFDTELARHTLPTFSMMAIWSAW
jgi:predicted TIM-barrel fold metal-dependent hydrolase